MHRDPIDTPIELIPWLQKAVSEKTQVEFCVFIPLQTLTLVDAQFDAGRWYILSSDEYKNLLKNMAIEVSHLLENNNRSFNVNLLIVFSRESFLVKDYDLTAFVNFLVDKKWDKISRAQLIENSILIDSAGDLSLYKKATINNAGHTYGEVSILPFATGSLKDFFTRAPVRKLADHKIINSLVTELKKYKKQQMISLRDCFSNLEDQQTEWYTVKDYFTPENVMYGVVLFILIPLSFFIANITGLRDENKHLNWIDGPMLFLIGAIMKFLYEPLLSLSKMLESSVPCLRKSQPSSIYIEKTLDEMKSKVSEEPDEDQVETLDQGPVIKSI